MKRQIKLVIEYDGTNYSGWQSQINGIAIQDVLTRAVEKFTQHPATIYGASRTDAGVHALGQVATFFTEGPIPTSNFVRGLNDLLPEDIRIQSAEEVSEKFHPQKDARWKQYEYRIVIRNTESALERNRVWPLSQKLDLQAMRAAAETLIGEHDFASFQGSGATVVSTVRILQTVAIFPLREAPLSLTLSHKGRGEKGEELCIRFIGNGFLKQMVRNIVGTLVEVGQGRRQPEEMREILLAKDRRRAGITAPPQGLYLVCVEY